MNDLSPAGFSYDPYAKEVLANPVPFYKELREHHPVYYVEKYDMFVFTRYQDVVDVMSITDDNALVGTPSTLPSPDMIIQPNHGAPPFASINPMGPGPTLPSPQYEQMRLAHMKPLRPNAVAALKSFTRDVTVNRLNELLPQGKFDIMWDYGGMVVASVTCQLYGIPLSDAPAVLDLVNSLTSYHPEIEAVPVEMFFTEMKKFIIPAIERRRAAGADGSIAIIDGLINFRTKEDGRALNDDEICNQLVCAFIANTETPQKPAGQGLLALQKHPDQLAAVRADLDTNVPIAVEEMLRICTTGQWGMRTAHKDITICGQHIRAGQRILVSHFSAARDEREYENADAFIWNRPTRRILNFGFGQHHCIGNHLARMQIRVLVHEFLARVKSYEFDFSEGVHSTSYFHWGWMKLPVIIKEHSL